MQHTQPYPCTFLSSVHDCTEPQTHLPHRGPTYIHKFILKHFSHPCIISLAITHHEDTVLFLLAPLAALHSPHFLAVGIVKACRWYSVAHDLSITHRCHTLVGTSWIKSSHPLCWRALVTSACTSYTHSGVYGCESTLSLQHFAFSTASVSVCVCVCVMYSEYNADLQCIADRCVLSLPLVHVHLYTQGHSHTAEQGLAVGHVYIRRPVYCCCGQGQRVRVSGTHNHTRTRTHTRTHTHTDTHAWGPMAQNECCHEGCAWCGCAIWYVVCLCMCVCVYSSTQKRVVPQVLAFSNHS